MKKGMLPSHVKFLLSDDVRSEEGGKLTIIGLYADDKILVIPNSSQQMGMPAAVMPALAITCIATGGDGLLQTRASFTDPSGNQSHPQSLGNQPTEFKAGIASTIVIKVTPFIAATLGQYSVTLQIGTKNYLFPFELVDRTRGVAPLNSSKKTARAARKQQRRKP